MRSLLVIGVVLASAAPARAQAWVDATADCLGTTAEWTNHVEVADVDGDGHVDLLLANGGDDGTAGTAEPSRVWKNLGTWGGAGPHCVEISAQALLGFTGLSRVIKAVDVDGDDDVDLITGGAYQTQLRLYLRVPTGWLDATALMPQQPTSIGDLEAGDVDGDGDLDLLLADWGATSPASAVYPGGRTRLYKNDGQGTFTDVTASKMPDLLVLWSWDVELADLDRDWDLDALVACSLCTTSYVFENDGTGGFTHATGVLPPGTANRDLAVMDVDRDGDLDLATINDGDALRERILLNNGVGVFSDATGAWLVGTANPPDTDDNVAVWLDFDGDADPDLLVGGRGADRLLINTSGQFTLATASTPADTPSTLGLAAADLDGDGRLDLLHGQGEATLADKVQLATATIAVDVVPPSVIVQERLGSDASAGPIHARVHDYRSPSRLHDFQRVWLEHDGYAQRLMESAPPAHTTVDMTWRGGYLWAAPHIVGISSYRACATDRRNNTTCSDWVYTYGNGGDGGVGPDTPDGGVHGDGGTGGAGSGGAGCCDAGGGSGGSVLAGVLVLLVLRRRRPRQNPTDLATVR